MRIGIFDHHWAAAGGGERYAGTMAQLLSADHDVDLLSHAVVDLDQLGRQLSLDLQKVSNRVLKVSGGETAQGASSDYDVFVNCSYRSTSPSLCPHSLYITFFPTPFRRGFSTSRQLAIVTVGTLLRAAARSDAWAGTSPDAGGQARKPWLKRLYARWPLLLTEPSSLEFLDSYETVVSVSEFTQRWVERYWRRDSWVLYPAISSVRPQYKENIILSVGRFNSTGFRGLKKQLELVNAFRQLVESGLDGWEYHLVGGVSPGDRAYLGRVVKASAGLPITIHPNATRGVLEELCGRASIFWHGTGLGEKLRSVPERAEHFGITTAEAMSARAVPIVFDAGGQREIIRHEKDGFLFGTVDELKFYTSVLIADDGLRVSMGASAQLRAAAFGLGAFEERLRLLLASFRDGFELPR